MSFELMSVKDIRHLDSFFLQVNAQLLQKRLRIFQSVPVLLQK